MSIYARPRPDVDSLASARSAVRAFGFAEFLSLIPNRLKSPPGRRNSNRMFLDLRMSIRPIRSYKFSKERRTILPAHEPPGSAGVPPASREPKAGTRRRDASAARNCAPVQGFQAQIRSGKSLPGERAGVRASLPPCCRGST
jgi:hypothetical protein